MKPLLIFSLAGAAILIGCSSAPEKVGLQGISDEGALVTMPNFLVLDQAELAQLSLSVRTEPPTSIKLTAGKRASCGQQRCVISDTAGSRIPVTPGDVAALVALQGRAKAAKREMTQVSGPVTLHCTGEKCGADLVVQAKPVRIDGKVKVQPEMDVAGTVLQGFVKGLFGG